MKKITKDISADIEKLGKHLRDEFRRKGFEIPEKNSDGSIGIGSYKIIKYNQYYKITDLRNNIIVDNINLPHTAALLTNSLALGRFIDYDLLKKDQKYGYAEFEEQLHDQRLKKAHLMDVDAEQLSLNKRSINRAKKQQLKNDIAKRFEKLRKFV